MTTTDDDEDESDASGDDVEESSGDMGSGDLGSGEVVLDWCEEGELPYDYEVGSNALFPGVRFSCLGNNFHLF